MNKGEEFFSLQGPLGATPAEWQTRAAHLHGFSSMVFSLGRRPDNLLERHDIDPRVLRDPDGYVDCRSLINLVEECSFKLDQPLFGLDLARRQSTHIFGSVGLLGRAAPDFGSALKSFCAYLPVLHSPQCKLELLVGERNSELRFGASSDFAGTEQLNFGGGFALLSLFRELNDGDFAPNHISICCRMPMHQVDALERALSARVLAGAAHNSINFRSEMLARPLQTADRLVFRLLGDYFAKVEAEHRHALIQRVEDYINGALPEGCTLGRCAAALGMHARALQSRLSDFGMSFSDMLAKKRVELAERYLSSDELTLDEIACRLGYAEQTSFGRAFRRLTGSTPGAYKADLAQRNRH